MIADAKRRQHPAVPPGLLIVLLALAGCNSDERSADSGTIPVVVSIQPQKWLVEQVGGEHVDVLVLVGSGDDPHSYQPTDAQISRVMRSAVYFRIGVPFEDGPWFRAISGTGKLDVVDTRQGIELREMEAEVHEDEAHGGHHGHDHEGHAHHDHGGRDPHIWTSPRLLKIQARTIAQSLSELAPEREQAFQQNLAALEARLDELDAAIRAKLSPHSGRAMFVFHPAWGYFADEYGLRQVAVEVEGKEPSDSELTELQHLARKEGAKVLFLQPQISGQSAAAVARTVGARVEVLDPLAADPSAELLRAAEILAESYRPEGG